MSKRNNQSFRASADFPKQKKSCWFKEQNNVFAFFTVRRNRRGQHADGFQVLLEKDMLSDIVIDLELLQDFHDVVLRKSDVPVNNAHKNRGRINNL